MRDKAIGDYSDAIRRNPSFAAAHHNRGYEYELFGKYDEALADYRRALEITPGLKPAIDAVNRLMKEKL